MSKKEEIIILNKTENGVNATIEMPYFLLHLISFYDNGYVSGLLDIDLIKLLDELGYKIIDKNIKITDNKSQQPRHINTEEIEKKKQKRKQKKRRKYITKRRETLRKDLEDLFDIYRGDY
jgi:GTPase involved in cell partitioning and DNA repair